MDHRSQPGPNANRKNGSRLRREVEPVVVHDLDPGRDEVLDELDLRIALGVDLGDGAQDGVRTEDEVVGRGGPPDGVDAAGTAFVDVLTALGREKYRGAWSSRHRW